MLLSLILSGVLYLFSWKKKIVVPYKMGGNKSRKKNCSGCKGYHRGPWGPNQCGYIQKSPGSGKPSNPGSGGLTPPSSPPPVPQPGMPPRLAGEKGERAFKDNETYMDYLENRIHQWEEFHHRKDEEDRIKDLETKLRQLELSGQQRSAGGVADAIPAGFSHPRQPVPSAMAAATFANMGQPPFPTADHLESPTLSQDDHGKSKKSNSKFRPDFHVDVQKSLDKFTFREYMLGCVCVAEALAAEGRPVAGYLSHIRFMVWKATVSGGYQTQTLIKYDLHVSTKVIRGMIPDGVLGEEEAMCLHLGVDGTMAFKQLAGTSRSVRGSSRGDFSDFPSDVYWLLIIDRVILLSAKGNMCVICVEGITG